MRDIIRVATTGPAVYTRNPFEGFPLTPPFTLELKIVPMRPDEAVIPHSHSVSGGGSCFPKSLGLCKRSRQRM